MESYSLSDAQVREFDKLGFIAPPGKIDKNLFPLLDQAASKLIDSISRAHDHQIKNVAFTHANNQKLVSRINNLFTHMQPEFLLLLGSPQILDVAYSLCGENALPTYESLMLRTLGDNTYTSLHQDMIHDRTSRISTYCIYLDDATPNDGSVRVIPETQHQQHDLNQFDELYKSNQWEFKDLTAKAGDLFLHDAMIIHDSPALTQRQHRRTLYFEFRSYKHLEKNPCFSKAWIEKRMELMDIAKNKYSAFIEGESYEFTESEKAFITTLYSVPVQIEPANYPIL
jgi:hypothetical protein